MFTWAHQTNFYHNPPANIRLLHHPKAEKSLRTAGGADPGSQLHPPSWKKVVWIGSNVRASNEGLWRPRVARAQIYMLLPSLLLPSLKGWSGSIPQLRASTEHRPECNSWISLVRAVGEQEGRPGCCPSSPIQAAVMKLLRRRQPAKRVASSFLIQRLITPR